TATRTPYSRMTDKITHYPIQELVSGDKLHVTSFDFGSDDAKHSCYLQANVHGPEILGSGILFELIRMLRQSPKLISGRLRIVPQAIPNSTLSQQYGYLIGRWNLQNGKNWNRIFKKSVAEPDRFSGIEDHYAYLLQKLAQGFGNVVDIHTAGARVAPFIFTRPEFVRHFSPLRPVVAITYLEEDYYRAFDESMWFASSAVAKVCTWECGSHQTIDRVEVSERLQDLLTFLVKVGVVSSECDARGNEFRNVDAYPIKEYRRLSSPFGGYLIWQKAPMEAAKRGEVIAIVNNVQTGEKHDITADRDLIVFNQFALQAVCAGQEICRVLPSGD
ncbi:MAG: succinylglutamate desuccinylase/aspartoacylase family protein, partial [bacterium]|nr:succinylglutamate desuccinylase/aspartoacylase family protein [bacterium]